MAASGLTANFSISYPLGSDPVSLTGDFADLATDVDTALGLMLPKAGGTLTGKLTGSASSTVRATLNIPHGTAPSSPSNGDVWTTTAGAYVRVNGTTVGPLGTGGGGGGTWGSITGTLSGQTDLQSALDAKLNLTGGTMTGTLVVPTIDIGTGGPKIMKGTVIPNGFISGPVASLYYQTDSAFGVTWWIKRTGTGSSGWVIEESTPALSAVNETNMNHWRDKLAAARNNNNETARIMCMGTSNVYGWGPTDIENNAFPFRLAKNLNSRVAPAVKFMEPTNNFTIELVHSRTYMTISGDWDNSGDTAVADAGRLYCPSGGTGNFTYTHPDCEYFTVLVRDWDNNFRLQVDSETPVTITGLDTGEYKEIRIDAPSRGAHTLTIDNVLGANELIVAAVGGGIDSGILVSNYGVPGSTSTDWRKDSTSAWGSLKATILHHQPDLVLYTIGGGNEVTDGISTATFKSDIEYTLNYIQTNSDASIIVSGPIWPDGYDDYKTAAIEACATYDVPFFDVWKIWDGDTDAYAVDGHVNDEAHRIWAKELTKVITEL